MDARRDIYSRSSGSRSMEGEETHTVDFCEIFSLLIEY